MCAVIVNGGRIVNAVVEPRQDRPARALSRSHVGRLYGQPKFKTGKTNSSKPAEILVLNLRVLTVLNCRGPWQVRLALL